jgi:hypothetical protein
MITDANIIYFITLRCAILVLICCSGMGGSSILAGCVLQAIATVMGKFQSHDDLLMLVLQVSTNTIRSVNITTNVLYR